MKHQPLPQPVEIPIDRIQPFISRDRPKDAFDDMKASIAKDGLRQPIGVRDIRHLPAAERKRQDGGEYWYQRIWGEGRILAHQQLKRPKIWAIVGDFKEADTLGLFLNENLVRTSLPWKEKALLVKADLESGRTHEQIAKDLSISVRHVQKFERILSKTAQGLEQDVLSMSMNDAEVVTTLPTDEQAIVIQVMKETGQREIQSLVKKARQVTESEGKLSPMALKKSIQRVDDDLKSVRDRLKVTRLHVSLGPLNLETLLADPKFKRAADAAGLPYKKFQALLK